MTAEDKGREFLQFVAANDEKLKHSLAKNVDYDPDIFDDAFQDAVLKVYNCILNGSKVNDFKNYFFIVAKRGYFNELRSRRIKAANELSVSECANIADETHDTAENEEARQSRKSLEVLFGKESADLFVEYIEINCDRKITYRQFAKMKGLTHYAVRKSVGLISRLLHLRRKKENDHPDSMDSKKI